jgi:hypothetical protein
MKARLLHPDPNVLGLGVRVGPVGVATTRVTCGATKINCVAEAVEAVGDNNESGVAVAVGVTVGVTVAGGTMAVCV